MVASVVASIASILLSEVVFPPLKILVVPKTMSPPTTLKSPESSKLQVTLESLSAIRPLRAINSLAIHILHTIVHNIISFKIWETI